MKISELLAQAQDELTQAQVDNPRLDARLLLAHITEFSKEKIIFNPDLVIDAQTQRDFERLVARRKQRQPMAHILGKREFYGRDFMVTPDVLDPRCDSESLIEMVLAYYGDGKHVKFLEIGCGSGCLTVTLLKELQQAHAHALDISDKALAVAAKNARYHHVSDAVQFLQSDLFSQLDDGQQFDLIISNPPYIASADIEDLQAEVKDHEPRLALDGGQDGLDFYRHIARHVGNVMTADAKVILEIGIGQEQAIADIFAQHGYVLHSQKKDLAQVIRNLCFVKE